MCDRGGQRHGVCKKRRYRGRGLPGSSIRRRPSPLGQLLAFLVSGLVTCTKKIVIAPSQYIIDTMIAAFFQRRELRNAQCGPSSNWDSSLSTYVTTAKKDTTIIGNLIDIMRPAMVKLIADTTTLKRWLQATALNNASSTTTTTTTMTTSPPTEELTNAIRRIETIDCWAYELFFHLKYLQVKRAPRTANKVTAEAETEAKPSDVIHANLWHRLVQLRDNYIILYDTLQTFEKIRDLDPENSERASKSEPWNRSNSSRSDKKGEKMSFSDAMLHVETDSEAREWELTTSAFLPLRDLYASQFYQWMCPRYHGSKRRRTNEKKIRPKDNRTRREA
ncbi:uncharacterized protein LOC143361559 [Halictus rubicundus]|uniref:uncharacterized protein LOC143361559 n=1 Tax=Halictus rubicundus TaxID=77578 RepID=UPI004035860B